MDVKQLHTSFPIYKLISLFPFSEIIDIEPKLNDDDSWRTE